MRLYGIIMKLFVERPEICQKVKDFIIISMISMGYLWDYLPLEPLKVNYKLPKFSEMLQNCQKLIKENNRDKL